MKNGWIFLMISFLFGALTHGQGLMVHSQNDTIHGHGLTAVESIVFKDGIFKVQEVGCQDYYYSDFFTNKIYFSTDYNEVSTIEKVENLVLYPNPVTDLLYIQTEQKITTPVEIYNLQGGLIQSVEAVSINSGIDVSALNSGVYLLRIEQQTYKFVKR